MADLEPVIGLEIHVQLSTKTKMFCGCALSFGDQPNVHTCPICLAHPGVLPVPNEEAIRSALLIAAALQCEVASRSIFHRKNYFYPDSSKAYQISQYDAPLAGAGRLGEVRIHRAHLEEDAAKMIHVGESGRIHGSGASLVDFNRSGTPLVEIVTEPDLRSAAQAAEWARLLRTTIRQLGVSDVNMEEGSLRCDANVSLRPRGSAELGTKTELKNMNSFRFLQRGIEAELTRQRELLEGGGSVVQETLHFDPQSGSLTSLRSKEEAHDYRYFPEPDLVPIAPTAEILREVGELMPELPLARIERYREQLGLSAEAARLFAEDPSTAEYFEQALAAGGAIEPRVIANWVSGELAAALRQAGESHGPVGSKVSPDALAALVQMVAEDQISHATAKGVISTLIAEGGDPSDIVAREGLSQISDSGELEAIVEAALAENPEAVTQIQSGNGKAIGVLIGAVMKQTQGRADGGLINRLITEKLKG